MKKNTINPESAITCMRIRKSTYQGIKDIAFWERRKIHEVISEALDKFVAEHNAKTEEPADEILSSSPETETVKRICGKGIIPKHIIRAENRVGMEISRVCDLAGKLNITSGEVIIACNTLDIPIYLVAHHKFIPRTAYKSISGISDAAFWSGVKEKYEHTEGKKIRRN